MEPQSEQRRSAWTAPKVIGLIVAGLILTCAGLGLAGYLWFKRNLPRLEVESDRVAAEAREFGNGRSSEDCNAESLRRFDTCGEITCQVMAKVFFRECLKHAMVPEDFCAGVPKEREIIASVTWRVSRCARAWPTDQRCSELVGAIQEHCHPGN